MRRTMTLCTLALLALASTGAKAQGCSAEVDPGDSGAGDSGAGDSGALFLNASFEVAEPTSVLGMSCAWLEGDNCWKQMIEEASACGPPAGAIGRLASDGRHCTFDTGHVLDFGGFVSLDLDPDGGSGTTSLVSYRMRAPDGSVCLETAFGWGKQRFRTGSGDTFQSLAGISTEITCRDGVRYAQGGPNTCGDFNAKYWAGKTPFHSFVSCGNTECVISYSGAPEGTRVIARCRP